MRMACQRRWLLALVVLVGCGTPPTNSPSESIQLSANRDRLAQIRPGTDRIYMQQGVLDRTVMVDPGDPKEAGLYYESVEKELGKPLPTLNAILTFLGYPGLTGKDVENLDSRTLMDPALLAAAVTDPAFQASIKKVSLTADDVLVARFFAPKITDVAVAEGQTTTLGWRKVVRLKARAESPAQDAGVVTGWLLFNVFSNDANPFTVKSDNNQVMLIRGAPTAALKPVYWLVFGSVNNQAGDGERIDFLNASFDNRFGGNKKYYVPDACAHCHGGLSGNQPDYAAAKLNYFDTDHWFDRTKDDFTNLPSDTAVIFDGGTDTTSAEFKQAFDVFQKLNAEVQAQNKIVDAKGETFQFRAVTKWLDLHRQNVAFIDIFERNIAPTSGQQWTKDNPIDRQVLPLLNRYCFRCHSSIAFHVFDKDLVTESTPFVPGRLNRQPTDQYAMPQDRDLRARKNTERDRQCLVKLAPHIGTNTQVTCP
jgi:hypothetical protein